MGGARWRTPDEIKLGEIFQEILVGVGYNRFVLRKKVLVDFGDLGLIFNSRDFMLITP